MVVCRRGRCGRHGEIVATAAALHGASERRRHVRRLGVGGRGVLLLLLCVVVETEGGRDQRRLMLHEERGELRGRSSSSGGGGGDCGRSSVRLRGRAVSVGRAARVEEHLVEGHRVVLEHNGGVRERAEHVVGLGERDVLERLAVDAHYLVGLAHAERRVGGRCAHSRSIRRR